MISLSCLNIGDGVYQYVVCVVRFLLKLVCIVLTQELSSHSWSHWFTARAEPVALQWLRWRWPSCYQMSTETIFAWFSRWHITPSLINTANVWICKSVHILLLVETKKHLHIKCPWKSAIPLHMPHSGILCVGLVDLESSQDVEPLQALNGFYHQIHTLLP